MGVLDGGGGKVGLGVGVEAFKREIRKLDGCLVLMGFGGFVFSKRLISFIFTLMFDIGLFCFCCFKGVIAIKFWRCLWLEALLLFTLLATNNLLQIRTS